MGSCLIVYIVLPESTESASPVSFVSATKIRLSEVHRKTGVELVSKCIVGRHLGTKQKVTSQIRSFNTIVDELDTSLPLDFGKANHVTQQAP